MKRTLLITCLVVTGLIGSPRAASANLWSWLEDLSGPGPFKGGTLLLTFCAQDHTIKPGPIARDGAPLTPKPENQSTVTYNPLGYPRYSALVPVTTEVPPPTSSLMAVAPDVGRSVLTSAPTDVRKAQDAWRDRMLSCFYVDVSHFHADAGRGFPAVGANLFELGGAVRILDGLDIGAGGGVVHFGTDKTSTSKGVITPIRVTTRPLLLALPGHRHKTWMGAISLYWKETLILGPIDAADFGADSSPFHSSSELVRSLGVNLDAASLLSLIHKGKK